MKSSTSPITILGIDPGIARLGWGVIRSESNSIKAINYGVIETTSKQPTHERIVAIYNDLSNIIKKYNPNQVAVEKLFFGKNAKTAMLVGEARCYYSYPESKQTRLYRVFSCGD